MSLPPTTKDISSHPAKGSVADPINKVKLERDVERKLKLYSSIQALRASQLPSNSQVNSLLDYFKKNIDGVSSGDKYKLSKDTKRLFGDLNTILDAVRAEVQDKNGDELIQDFVWRTRVKDLTSEVNEGVTSAKGTDLPVEKDKAKQDADQAVNHIRTLFNLLLTNSEARKLISDFSVVGRDLLSRGAVKAAGAIAPNEDQLARVDDSTRQDTFHETDAIGDAQRAHESTKQSAFQKKEEIKGEVKDTANTSTNEARQQGAVLEPRQPGEVTDGEVVAPGKKGIKSFFNGLSDKIPEQHKNAATDQYNQGKQFLTEEYFPQERRDQWIWRAKKVVVECQSHPEYQSSLKWLLDFVEEYYGHGRTFAQGHIDNAQDKGKNASEITSTLTSLRVLLDRFANNKSFDDLVLDKVNTLADDAQKDQELRQWWSNIAGWTRKILLTPGYILEPAANNDGRKILDEGKKFYGSGTPSRLDGASPIDSTATSGVVQQSSLGPTADGEQGRYRAHFDNLFQGLSDWTKGIAEDDQNKVFGESVTRLIKDLLYVEDGGDSKLTFKREMWGDLRRVVVPMLVDRVGYIPIPRIEYTDDNLDLVVENLTMSGKNIFPNIVSVEAHNYLKFSPYSAITKEGDDARHELIITLAQMQADMRDVAFYFKKKSGIKMQDSGLADVVISGEGVSVTIHIVSSSKDPSSFFQVKNIHVKLDSVKFSIRDSKHDLLYKTLKPLATGLVKKQIAKAIHDGIETGLGIFDGQLVSIRDRMEKARLKKNPDGTEMSTSQGRLSAIGEIFKSKSREASEVASTMTSQSHSQFKVVSNKRNSILANEGHPAGWANRVTEKHEFAQTDGGWKSDAFNIENLTTSGDASKASKATPTKVTPMIG